MQPLPCENEAGHDKNTAAHAACRHDEPFTALKSRPFRGWYADLVLLAVAAIWGGTFVTVQDAVANFPVITFLAIRFTLATLVFLPLLRRSRRPTSNGMAAPRGRRVLLPSMLIGIALCAGYAFQTYGLRFTTPAKAGFITGIAVVLVPIGSALFLRRPPTAAAMIGVALAAFGLAALTLNRDLTIAPGDLLVLGCAISFAAQILLVGRFAPHFDAIALAAGQIAAVAVLSWLAALVVDGAPRWPAGNVWFAAAFTGILATAFAFWAQTMAQRFASPTHTALIFATEPVFAAIFSFLLIGEQLTTRALLGCGLILAGMLISELGVWPRPRHDEISKLT